MRTHLFVALPAALACSVALGAQSSTQAPTQKSGEDRVTITGCVERADQMAGNAATTTVDSLSFVLIKSQAEKPTGTSGASTSSADTQPNRMYRLDGKQDELNPHVGQKVEVSGTVADAPTAPAGATSSTNAPRLKVESIRVLEPTCPR